MSQQWITRCVFVSGTPGEHTVRLRGVDPALDLVLCAKTELPYHVDNEYVVTIEPADGEFV